MHTSLRSIENIAKPAWLCEGDQDKHWNLRNLEPVTIIFGKNGSGKSNLLKAIAQKKQAELGDGDEKIRVKYLKTSPERGGIPKIEGGVQQQLANDATYLQDINLENESRQFRSVAVSNFRELFVNLGLKDPGSIAGESPKVCRRPQ